MPDGGKLIIETSNYEVEGLHAELFPGLRPGLYVRLAIHDSGVGMAPEVKARLFEPFFTTKGVDKGTGLGLATVYGIVKQGGGFIRAESEPGYGSTFEVLFPRIADEAPKDAKPAPTRSTQGSESVLIVEDDPQVREVTTRSLRSAGYAVLVARDGVEALDLLAKHHLRLDLLVTDVIMPNLDGRQLADAVRKQWPGLRVLFVSGHAHELLDHRGVLAAGVDLLPKPYTPASLLARVRESLDRNGPSPARSAGEG
jgi:CheY-like chemotaxis protein